MPSCVVVGCTSGYKSNPEKSHIFRVPKNPEIQSLWIKALEPSGIKIKTTHSVCDKHFRSHEILWQRELLGLDGSVVGISPYKVPQLKKGSVPSIFPWTELINPEREIRIDQGSHNSLATIEDTVDFRVADEKYIHKSSSVSQTVQPDEPDGDSSIDTMTESTDDFSLLQSVTTPMKLTIEELASMNISMISGWMKQTMTCEGTMMVQFSFSQCIKMGDSFKSFVQRELIVKDDMSYQISILGMEFCATNNTVNIDFSPIHTIQRLQDLLLTLNGLNICIGMKAPVTNTSVIDSSLCKDLCGTWRHSKCSLLLTMTTVCLFCQRARKAVTTKLRKIKNSEETPKILRLKLSPRKKKFFDKLRRKYHSAEKAKQRAQIALLKTKSELEECRRKISSKEDSLNQYLESSKLPHNQSRALKQIVAAAKCGQKKGRRYSEEWILLCMLLHMQSSSGYSFLNKNEILPLPSIRTIRRYLSNLDISCGVDARFVDVLELALSKKEEHQKHGV